MTTRGSVDGIYTKLRWSVSHFERLASLIEGWVESQGEAPREGELNAERTQYIETLTFTETPNLTEWGLVLYDAIHGLRSTLDHLAYQLAITKSRHDPPPNKKTVQFPIYRHRTGFRGWRKGGLDRGKYVPRGALGILEAAQPYERRGKDALWYLHELDNLGKHRLIYPMVMDLIEMTADDPAHLAHRGIRSVRSQIRSDNGAIRTVFSGDRIVLPEDPMNVKLTTTFEVAVRLEGTPLSITDTSREMLAVVVELIESLSPFL